MTWSSAKSPSRREMKNVEMRVEGTILTITIDLSKDFGPSLKGNSRIVATTRGKVLAPGREEIVDMSVYRMIEFLGGSRPRRPTE